MQRYDEGHEGEGETNQGDAAEQALRAAREERTQARREWPVAHICCLADLAIAWDDRLVVGRARSEATRQLSDPRCGLAWVARAAR